MADAFARRLRKEMTPPEVLMWVRLRALRAQGWHFRRQVPEQGYILDFVCRTAGLVIEVDGADHAERRAYDAKRDAVLADLGLRTLRLHAVDVLANPDAALETVLQALGARGPGAGREQSALPKAGQRYRRLVRLGLRKD